MAEPEGGLRRVLGAGAITVYAVGDILGAGIYALVGKVAAEAGGGAWISFFISATLALFTGLTYAELSSRFPVAAGAAAYSRRAFAHPAVSFLVGVFVLVSGITSAATVSRAFVGYLDPFVTLPPLLASLALLALMTLINWIGIQESARVNFVLTAIELGGLLLVLTVGFGYAFAAPAESLSGRLLPAADFDGVLTGATIAFFAYIGFEDTVNVAEEVKDASRVLPRAILTAIGFTCVVYAGVTIAALLTVPLETLATSGAPLLEVLKVADVRVPGEVFSLVALFAICNTGLLNLIMASRLSYGMAREGLLPMALARVDPKRRTPWVAVLGAFVLAAALAASGGVQELAQTTSLLLLCVFTLLHVALLVVKRRDPGAGDGFRTPLWTPVVGALLCGGMALQYPAGVYGRAALVLAAGVVLYFVFGRRPLASAGASG
ncbi:MAG: APC family permease [Candidatus Binatia bacterium]